jgi:hypothetical protein
MLEYCRSEVRMNWSGPYLLCLVASLLVFVIAGNLILAGFSVQNWFARSLVIGLSCGLGVAVGQLAHRRFFAGQ